MDMMRPVSVAVPPNAPDGLAGPISGNGANTRLTLTWNDNSINETAFVVQRNDGSGWIDVGTVPSPLDQPNTHGTRTYTDTTFRWNNTTYSYRVVARNSVGYGGAFMSLSVQSVSAPVAAIQAPTNLAATLQAGPQVSLTWTDNANNETGFVVQRSTDGVTFVQIGTAPARNNTGTVNFTDPTILPGTTYRYRVAAFNTFGQSAWSLVRTLVVPSAPAAPTNLAASAVRVGNGERVTLTWTDNATNETGYTVQRSTDPNFLVGVTTYSLAANSTMASPPRPSGGRCGTFGLAPITRSVRRHGRRSPSRGRRNRRLLRSL